MTVMILGLLVFLGGHSVQMCAPGLRAAMINRLGRHGWRGLYSLVSLIGLYLLVKGYAGMRVEPGLAVLWDPPGWIRHLASVLMLVSFIFLTAAFVPGNSIKSRVGHPMLVSVTIWAFAHLLSNGRVGDLVFFGAFLVWAVADFIVNRQRDRAAALKYPPGGVARTALTVVIGTAAWAGFALWLHLTLIGVAPFGHG